MAHLIIYDPEHNIAALVDPDSPAALGPITVGDPGEDPRLPLREFLGGLDTPPEQMGTWPLFNEWQSYIRALVDMTEQALSEHEAAADGGGAAPPGETPQGAAPAAEEAANEASQAAGGETPPDPAREGSGSEEAELSARIHEAPHTPAKDGREECWMCHGELQIDAPAGRTECPVCRGEGTTLPEAAQA